MITEQNKILIIRFSSFGDVTQSLSIPSVLAEHFSGAEIHWVTRSDLAPLLENHPHIHKIIRYERKTKIGGLFKLISTLKKERYSHIYDAHNSTRSWIISFFLRPPFALSRWWTPPFFIRKSQFRLKRFLLFKLRINTYEMPFSGQRDLLSPLKKWGINYHLPPTPQLFLNSKTEEQAREKLIECYKATSRENSISRETPNTFVALAPSAAFELKRWPSEYWIQLISQFPETQFILLGGPEDTFIEKIHQASPYNTLNMAGKLSLLESAAVIAQAKTLVSNDTGLLHVAEQLGVHALALMGPAPFGYPSRERTKKIELNLDCKPCSKHGQGPCVNKEFHKCLRGISPSVVAKELKELL